MVSYFPLFIYYYIYFIFILLTSIFIIFQRSNWIVLIKICDRKMENVFNRVPKYHTGQGIADCQRSFTFILNFNVVRY